MYKIFFSVAAAFVILSAYTPVFFFSSFSFASIDLWQAGYPIVHA